MTPGDKLGPYEILAPIGTGGMGEVYRARDTKLGRDVAIKVLPAALARDPDRLTRLEREARVLASLNHPNIAAIYGLEDNAIVMELVEGPTLAERIKAAPLPLEEALTIARAIDGATRSGTRIGRSGDLAHTGHGCDSGGHGPRHCGIHEPGTGQRQEGRQAR